MKKLTTASGQTVPNNQHSLTAGERGPILLQNSNLIEKLAHFNRERIPERVVHAKGSGAYGTLTITNDITKYSRAKVFDKIGKKTDMFLRFSTVAGERGSADTVRDPRGFAMKFYTEDGIWDLVGNNTPVFFERDPMKFPDFIHSQKRDPQTGYKDAQRVWDYWANAPQALHQITILFSDRGIPDGFRHMHGFGSHTFSFWNSKNQRFWVKFHLLSQQGIKNLSEEKANKIAGEDPDYAGRDLFEAIENKNFPKWDLKIQIMSEEEARNWNYNPFDLTKVWPKGEFPLIDVGTIELNKNPKNYFAEVEQAAFSPSNFVPGISASPDKMLQGRLFAYPDAQRYRVGANYQLLPVNRATNEVNNYQRDGAMRFDGNSNSIDNYEPNSFGGAVQDESVIEPMLKIDGDVYIYDSHKDNDDYTQAGNLYRLMSEDKKEILIQNLANSLRTVSKGTVSIILEYLKKCDNDYGSRVEKKL